MDKTYQPRELEQHWYQKWEQAGYFKPSGTGTPYTIMIPPPNVTGSLHMGHGFNNTIMDTLVRYHRMKGHNTLWQPGTDHAGIATQMVVERQLGLQGLTRHDLGREAFLEKVWEWKEESGGTITRQIRRLGSSVDWSRERFTMDPGLSNAVQEVFVRLFDDGLIYRGKRLVNWDPKLHTAISDLEVLSEEEKGSMWHFRYPLADGSGHLVVATTRPETMLGDAAVAVSPEDERYNHLIGKMVRLPIADREIPIIADDYVDKDFGTGCVKITPAHDFNDYAVWQRHKQELSQLPLGGLINIFNKDAAIKSSIFDEFSFGHRARAAGTNATFADTELTDTQAIDIIPQEYRGLDRFVARKKIIAQAESEGWLEKVEPHTLKVPRGDRSGVVIEPWLTDQWYVRTAPLAAEAIKAVEDGRIEFVPKQYENMYFAWMRDIQDWCVSRQLWWGHRIPAWYDDTGRVYVGRTEQEVRSKYNLDDSLALRQDDDVLDTWFSSALWTFSTLGWPEQTPELKTFHPTDVLVTGFDIIFFWVARMIMMTLHFMKNEDGTPQVPFKTVYVHGLVRDSEGQKMSKSKGNVLDPIDIIDGIDLEALVGKRTTGLMKPQDAPKIENRTRKEYPDGISAFGTDALRFTFASLASTGRDINWDMKRLEGYRNFCNKIWNAARYVCMNVEGKDCGLNDAEVELTLADRWIRSKLQHAEQEVSRHLAEFRFDLASQAIYDFVWNEYCDWYVELSKPVLTDENCLAAIQRGTRRTLVQVLEAMMRLAHPFIPFITEEIWQRIAPLAGKAGDTIMTQPYPEADASKIDAVALADVEWVKGIVLAVRNIRGEMNIAPGKPIKVLLKNMPDSDQARLAQNRNFICSLARLETLELLDPTQPAPMSSTQIVGAMEVLVPMAGLIDTDAEIARLSKELDKVQKEIARLEGKLGNASFAENAPADVVEKEKERLAAAISGQGRIDEQIRQLRGV